MLHTLFSSPNYTDNIYKKRPKNLNCYQLIVIYTCLSAKTRSIFLYLLFLTFIQRTTYPFKLFKWIVKSMRQQTKKKRLTCTSRLTFSTVPFPLYRSTDSWSKVSFSSKNWPRYLCKRYLQTRSGIWGKNQGIFGPYESCKVRIPLFWFGLVLTQRAGTPTTHKPTLTLDRLVRK